MPATNQEKRRRPRIPALAAAVFVVIALGAAFWWVTRPRTIYARLAATGAERAIAPQTSLAVRYRACVVTQTDSLVPGATCMRRPDSWGATVEAIYVEASRRMQRGPDADALRVLGLLELSSFQSRGPRPAEAISYFDSALRVTHDSAAVMTDLAAAYLVFAEQRQSMDDLLRALEWSDWALELEPGNRTALFNRAMALEALMADISARQAWEAYLGAEPTGIAAFLTLRGDGAWRNEAEQRLQGLLERGPPELPDGRANDATWRRFTLRFPQFARKHAWETLLPEWAGAYEKGDFDGAAARLHLAEVIGQQVAARPNGDRMVADQVRLIREMLARGENVGAIVSAFRVEKDVMAARDTLDHVRADSLLKHLAPGSLTGPQAAWLRLREAAVAIDLKDWHRAARELDAADSVVDATRYPVAAGYALWLRGTMHSRHNADFDGAAAYWRQAEAIYGRTGEPASRAMVQGYIAEIQALSGNLDAANEWSQRAARSSRMLGPSVGQHNVRRVAAITAQVAGLNRAMRDMADEDVAVARAFGETPFIDEALLTRAALLAASGHEDGARRDIAQSSSPDQVQSPVLRERLKIGRAYADALLQLKTHPDSVDATVAPLLAYGGAEFWRTIGLALRARAGVARGDTARASRDLESVFAEFSNSLASSGGALRLQSVNEVRPALLEFVLYLVEHGDSAGALRLLERGSAALSPIQVENAELPSAAPDGRVLVRPVLVDSTLLTWTLVGSRLEVTRTRVDPFRLRSAISAVGDNLPHGWDAERELRYLYDVLVGPVERRLDRPGSELVYVHDEELAGVPFVALLDRARTPVGIRHPVWSAVSMAAAAAQADTTPPRSVVFFAPRVDRALNPGLDSLPGAQAEVDAARRAYGARVLLPAPVAQTGSGFIWALGRAEVLHFAGHAVADEFRPERSYLVMLPDPARRTGHLTASALDTVPMAQMRLVVLSACSTLSGDGAARGFTGLSGAFLDAGAHGVVGSLWRVRDDPTRELMSRFHQHYSETRNPQRALWMAQHEMMISGNAEWSSPAVWAAFQYVGR